MEKKLADMVVGLLEDVEWAMPVAVVYVLEGKV